MNQKIETMLNVSMEVDDDIRDKSADLSSGYNNINDTWETIIKYNGELSDIIDYYEDINAKELLNGYAIVIATKDVIEDMAQNPSVIFIEKSKQMYFQLYAAKAASCINKMSVFTGNADKNAKNNLSGKGVLTAIIDTGVNIYSSEFRDRSGNTRIMYYYDQFEEKEYTSGEINELLKTDDLRFMDVAMHGTEVAAIACGNSGVAFGSDIIVVKMGFSYNSSFPRTAQLMEAVDYCVKKAVELKMPVSINISFGNNYGDHEGNSILEQYLNDAVNTCKCCICVGSGNEGQGKTHFNTTLKTGVTYDVEITVGNYEPSLDIQIWKKYQDTIRLEIIDPSGVNLGNVKNGGRLVETSSNNTEVTAIYGEPSPFNANQEIYVVLTGKNGGYVDSGTWRIRLIPENVVAGGINMWLPAMQSINEATGFSRPAPDNTFTIPSTASGVITVGAYDSRIGGIAAFSGRGNMLSGENGIKPDIVAPGVDIILPAAISNTGFAARTVTGTSYATPFVTGVGALMMEWGIIKGNDAFLYADKLKAYMIKGAIRAPGENAPDIMYGWGRLCGYDSIP